MAKRGQKFLKFSDDERNEIVNKYIKGGTSYQTIANEYCISPKTVESMVRKYRESGTTIAKRRGRIKENSLTINDWKERYEIIKKYQAFLKAQREKK